MNHEHDRPTVVVGCFMEPEDAQSAIRRLRETGISDRSIGMVTRGDIEPDAERAGAHPGGGGSWIVDVATGVMPGIGPVIAGGLLSGAITSGAARVLIDLGIPGEHASYYEGELRSGGTIVIVDAGERMADALEILRSCGSYNRYEAEYTPHSHIEGTGQTRLQPE